MVKLAEGVLKSVYNKKGYRIGKWNTRYKNGNVILSHYGTDMLKFNPKTRKATRSTGFESVSDKQGINKVLRELNIAASSVKLVKADRGFRF